MTTALKTRTTITRPAVTTCVTIRNIDYILADAINAAAVLAEVSAGHEDGAQRLAIQSALEDLAVEEMEALCEAFGVEITNLWLYA